MLSINFLAVFLAAVSAFVIGFLLHGPVLGKLWMRLANIHPTGNEKLSDMYGQLFWNFVSNFVTALGLAFIYALTIGSPFMSSSLLLNGIISGLVVWFGFIVSGCSIEVIWMGRSYKLWLFEVFCSLLVMVTMGVIISAFS